MQKYAMIINIYWIILGGNMKKEKINDKLFEFIENSPSPYHAIQNCKNILMKQGYVELEEEKEWQLEPQGKYFVTRNGSSMIAFAIPEGEFKGFHIVATHSDSPCLKVKEAPQMDVEKAYTKLNVETYGGLVYSSWLDRPLSVAGRIITKKETKLVNLDMDSMIIPNLAIHMNREINKGFSYNPQIDLLPLLGGKMEDDNLFSCIAKKCDVKKEEILGHDLFLYARQKPSYIGLHKEFICAPRLDDLQCVFGVTMAMVEEIPKEYVNICAIFDNEEVGSLSKQGADSTFLEDVIERIAECFYLGKGALMQKIAASFLISADNAHGLHPNHPEKADPTNRPVLNGGIVVKYSANQKYTTDGVSSAHIKTLCEEAKVPYQTFANRSDEPGGSTLGNISTAHFSVNAVDIGLPQLAMHCSVETAGSEDTLYLFKIMKHFYSA